jgi:hypothetical protein
MDTPRRSPRKHTSSSSPAPQGPAEPAVTKTTRVHHALGKDGSLQLLKDHVKKEGNQMAVTTFIVGPHGRAVSCWKNPELSSVTGKKSTKRYPKSKWTVPKILKVKGDGGRNGAELLLNRVAAAYSYFKDKEWPEDVDEFAAVVQFSKLHASHLCHEEDCFNPDHLWFEPHWYNDSRRLCACKGLPSDFLCPHVPACCGHNTTAHPLVCSPLNN